MLSRIPWTVYLALVLAGVVVWQGVRVKDVGLERSKASSAAMTVEDLKEFDRQQSLPDIDTSDFIDRPLFWMTRSRPEAVEEKPKAETTETAAELPPALKVSGVVRDGDSWFIVGKLGPKNLRLKTGEEVKGWTITEISPDNVIFTSGKKTATIKLFEPKPQAAAKKARPRAKSRASAREARALRQRQQAAKSKERDE